MSRTLTRHFFFFFFFFACLGVFGPLENHIERCSERVVHALAACHSLEVVHEENTEEDSGVI